jgi:WD40 repeat protein
MPVACVASRPDGRLACRTSDGLALVDPAALEVVRRVRLDVAARRGRTLAALRDGRVVVATAGEPLAVWDLDEGVVRARWRAHTGQTVTVAAAADLVASGGTDHRVRLWDPTSGTCVAEMAGHGAWVTSVAIDGAGGRVVSASADGTLRVWSRDGVCERVLSGHTGPVHAVVVDRLGERAVSGGADGTVRVWDLASGEAVRTFGGHSGPVEDVELVDGGLGAVSVGPHTVRVWDLERMTSSRQLRPKVRASDVEPIADGRTVAIAAGQEVLVVSLDLSESRRLPWALAAPESSVVLSDRSAEVAVLLDAARWALEDGRAMDAVEPLRAARRIEGFELDDQILALWSRVIAELPTAGLRTVAELRPLHVDGHVFVGAAFADGDSGLVAADTAGGVWRWLGRDGAGPRCMGTHDAPLGAIAGDPERRTAVTGDRAGQIRSWDLTAAGELTRVALDGSGITGVSMAPDGSVVGVSDDGRLWSWSVGDRVVREIGRAAAPLAAVACSPDGRRAVVGGWDDTATVWDLERGYELAALHGHHGALTAVAWMPDGRQVVTAATDGSVRVWDVASGACRRSIEAHRGEVADVAVGRGGRWIVSAGRDGAVTMWDPRSGVALAAVETGGRPVAAVAVSAAGDQLAAVFGDGSVRRWYVDHEPGEPLPDRWDDRAQPLLEARLTRWERDAGVVELPADAVEILESELMRHGYGRPRRSVLERHLQRLVETWPERRRAFEEQRDRRRTDLRRGEQRARAAALASPMTRNLGLKLVAAAAVLVALLLLVASLRTPTSDTVHPNRVLWPLVEAQFSERGARFRQATWVVSYQGSTVNQQPATADDCPVERRVTDLRMVLRAEEVADGPADEASASDGFRDDYRHAVQCVARMADDRTVRDVLARLRAGLVPHRQHDLVTVLIGAGERSLERLDEALGSGDVDVRHAAAFALAHLRSSAGRDRLVAALDDPRSTRVEAASFVLRELIVSGAIPADDAFETVRRLAASVDPRVRAQAVRALVLFERRGPAARVLEQALEDSEPEVRRTAEETAVSLREAKLQELFGR